MNKEEIFNEISSCFKMSVDMNGMKKLEEYITNLQQQCKKQKEVINKAIEYLEKSKLNQLDTYCKYLYIDFDTGKIENIDELLQILKGEDNNE